MRQVNWKKVPRSGFAAAHWYGEGGGLGVESRAIRTTRRSAGAAMIPSRAMPLIEAYIRTIRNADKREYARAYMDHVMKHPVTWEEINGPDYECSYMAAQAVRMAISEIARHG